MSYYSDNEKYGDFINSYTPTKKRQGGHKPPKKSPKRHLRPWVKTALAVIATVLATVIIALSVAQCSDKAEPTDATSKLPNTVSSVVSEAEQKSTRPSTCEKTVTLGEQIESKYAVLIDTSDNTVLARRNADDRIYPASMTKVMTLLVAAENIDDITKTYKMTSKVIDPLYEIGLSLAGFAPNEECKLIDLCYGTVLESGAEAAFGLADYVSGSEEEFVKLMNKKAAELGLTDTNFTNVTGKHDKNHYSTVTEMAIILKAAMDNGFCRQVLTTQTYTVPATNRREALTFHAGMFERMNGDEPEVAEIRGGKTGFTGQAMYCLASFAETDDGREIICVTAYGEEKYSPVHDCIKLYKEYTVTP